MVGVKWTSAGLDQWNIDCHHTPPGHIEPSTHSPHCGYFEYYAVVFSVRTYQVQTGNTLKYRNACADYQKWVTLKSVNQLSVTCVSSLYLLCPDSIVVEMLW